MMKKLLSVLILFLVSNEIVASDNLESKNATLTCVKIAGATIGMVALAKVSLNVYDKYRNLNSIIESDTEKNLSTEFFSGKDFLGENNFHFLRDYFDFSLEKKKFDFFMQRGCGNISRWLLSICYKEANNLHKGKEAIEEDYRIHIGDKADSGKNTDIFGGSNGAVENEDVFSGNGIAGYENGYRGGITSRVSDYSNGSADPTVSELSIFEKKNFETNN